MTSTLLVSNLLGFNRYVCAKNVSNTVATMIKVWLWWQSFLKQTRKICQVLLPRPECNLKNAITSFSYHHRFLPMGILCLHITVGIFPVAQFRESVNKYLKHKKQDLLFNEFTLNCNTLRINSNRFIC